MNDWKPQASIETLRKRSDVLNRIRKFFKHRNVLEVETPLLAHAAATDVFIQSFEVPLTKQTLYLQTSPEYAMKRLLAAGSGAIFQICKSFRRDEYSSRHNPEFTLLEWYRPDYSMTDLMTEVEELMKCFIGAESILRYSYREVFLAHLQFDPHSIEYSRLQTVARQKMDIASTDLSKTDYLQLLMDKFIEPLLPTYCFIYDFPIEQAALAVIEADSSAQLVAKRFELYGGGMELANGYFELTDATEQRTRIEKDLNIRGEKGLPQYPVDEKLLAALDSGMPPSAGVALGVDRLVMLLTGQSELADVLAFSTDPTEMPLRR